MKSQPTAVVVHLSGSRRGLTQRLQGDSLRLGTAAEAEIDFSQSDGLVAENHATLERRNGGYSLRVSPGNEVWVNGEPTQERALGTGDVLELGEGGPVLRFRLYPPESHTYKTLGEAFRDCVDCTRSARSPLQRALILLFGLPMELATQTSLVARAVSSVLLLALSVAVVVLAVRDRRLEERFEEQELQIGGVAELVRASERDRLTVQDLQDLRTQLEGEIGSSYAAAVDRIESLESRTEAAARVIAEASDSVVFVQGSYGFAHAESGQRLRLRLDENGHLVMSPGGGPAATLGGDGPPVEREYTGTAFVASPTGLLLTNRHVAQPWLFDDTAKAVVSQGLEPVLGRLVGYLPGVQAAFPIELIIASNTADLAVLRCSGVTTETRWLRLDVAGAEPGDEVIVMGYPTGLRALLARSDQRLVEELMKEGDADFWSLARRLSRAGQIGPLASRGIVGQVSPAAVVYDAATTGGGSGGPVLGLDGRVIAINAAGVPEFGGSNLGVPAQEASRLLADAAATETSPR